MFRNVMLTYLWLTGKNACKLFTLLSMSAFQKVMQRLFTAGISKKKKKKRKRKEGNICDCFCHLKSVSCIEYGSSIIHSQEIHKGWMENDKKMGWNETVKP